MTSNQQFWNDTDETVELVELFNTYFINVVENTTGQATTSLGDS